MEELEKKIEKIIKDLIYEAHMDTESIDDVLWKDKAINQLLELFKEERIEVFKACGCKKCRSWLMFEKLNKELNHTDRKDKEK